MIDMVLDIVVMINYYTRGDYGFAWAYFVCISSNLVLQSLFIIFAYRKKTTWENIREQLYVWFLVKPAVDVYRVSKEEKQMQSNHEHSIMSYRSEYTSMRIIEIITENVPGSIIQAAGEKARFRTLLPTPLLFLMSRISFPSCSSLSLSCRCCSLVAAILASGDISSLLIASFCSSLITSAMISANISFDWDVSKEQRATDPLFYGYLPKSKKARIRITLALCLLAFFNLATRALACVIFARAGPLAISLVVGEMCLYLAYKKFRGDFTYWVPAGSLFYVTVSRVMVKLVVDFTACAQLRHPNEVGGFYYR